jgi:hypothetical protein
MRQDVLRMIIHVFRSFLEKLYRRVLKSGRGPFALGFEEEGKGTGTISQQGRFSSTETNGKSVICRKEKGERGGRAKREQIDSPDRSSIDSIPETSSS